MPTDFMGAIGKRRVSFCRRSYRSARGRSGCLERLTGGARCVIACKPSSYRHRLSHLHVNLHGNGNVGIAVASECEQETSLQEPPFKFGSPIGHCETLVGVTRASAAISAPLRFRAATTTVAWARPGDDPVAR
jgi:hypothetical protein